MGKKKNTPVTSHRTGAEIKPAASAQQTQEQKQTGAKLKFNTILSFVLVLIAMLAIFLGRWVWAIMEEYYGSFVQRYVYSVDDAVENMKGLSLSDEENAVLLALQQQWDLFTASRLCDEVTMTSYDGVEMHGYLYNEGSDVTVVVVQRFDQDGEDDFLPGTWINGQTDCNILLIDQRNHGKSGGEVFSYGYYEQHDLVCWLEWCTENLGEQRFILWGEGTGANTILFAQANGLLPDSVAFAVAESSYASLHEMAKVQISAWYSAPAFPFLNAIEYKVNQESGFKISDTDLSAAMTGKDCALPVLFLESTTDEYIHSEWSQQVYNLYSGEKERISGGLSHGTVYAYCQEEIHATLAGWMDSYLD